MFEVGIGSTDANYMVLYENRLIKYYAKDPRELERLRNDFKNSDIILDIMNATGIITAKLFSWTV